MLLPSVLELSGSREGLTVSVIPFGRHRTRASSGKTSSTNMRLQRSNLKMAQDIRTIFDVIT